MYLDTCQVASGLQREKIEAQASNAGTLCLFTEASGMRCKPSLWPSSPNLYPQTMPTSLKFHSSVMAVQPARKIKVFFSELSQKVLPSIMSQKVDA